MFAFTASHDGLWLDLSTETMAAVAMREMLTQQKLSEIVTVGDVSSFSNYQEGEVPNYQGEMTGYHEGDVPNYQEGEVQGYLHEGGVLGFENGVSYEYQDEMRNFQEGKMDIHCEGEDNNDNKLLNGDCDLYGGEGETGW